MADQQAAPVACHSAAQEQLMSLFFSLPQTTDPTVNTKTPFFVTIRHAMSERLQWRLLTLFPDEEPASGSDSVDNGVSLMASVRSG